MPGHLDAIADDYHVNIDALAAHDHVAHVSAHNVSRVAGMINRLPDFTENRVI